ncbi:MAG: aminoacyl-tRNA hydrolase [Planctomycetota bacterium]
MKVIAGLGNPGRAYEGTRHNVGFDVVLLLAKAGPVEARGGESDLAWVRVRLPVRKSVPVPPKPDGQDAVALEAWRAAKKAARDATEEEPVLLATPLTFMNLSGPPIRRLLEENGSNAAEDLLVVVDDVDLAVGRLRLRREGSSGGHRGLESIEDALGTQRWSRLRLGVGRNPPGVPSEDWVLSPPSGDEARDLVRGVARAAEGTKIWLGRGPERAMDEINRNTETKKDETQE